MHQPNANNRWKMPLNDIHNSCRQDGFVVPALSFPWFVARLGFLVACQVVGVVGVVGVVPPGLLHVWVSTSVLGVLVLLGVLDVLVLET
jgi:hypothetical protein